MYTQLIDFTNENELRKADQLLAENALHRDQQLDYLLGLYQQDQLLAVGGAYKNILKCLAVAPARQAENLSNLLFTELINLQFKRGHSALYLYTKPIQAKKFNHFGFHEIVSSDKISFMTNQPGNFEQYLANLQNETQTQFRQLKPANNELSGSIVLHANPVTKGHVFLIEKAASEVDVLHLFLISEDFAETPRSLRERLLKQSTAHLENIIYHQTGDFLISRYTFPAYFIKEEESIIKAQAEIDALIFAKIAEQLALNRRYVGEEPLSATTAIYNQTLKEKLQTETFDLIIVPRLKADGEVISATTVRKILAEEGLDVKSVNKLEKLLPHPVVDFLLTKRGAEFIKKLQQNSKDA